MFKCALTGELSELSESPEMLVMARRERVYHDDDGNEVARGWEIVKEIPVRREHAIAWREEHADGSPFVEDDRLSAHVLRDAFETGSIDD